MEKLKQMKECLIAQAQGQMGHLEHTDAKELGEVIDMIKDLEEAEYYCAIVKFMEESKKDKELMEKMDQYGSPYKISQHYYTIPHTYDMYEDMRDMDRDYGRMYYSRGRARDSKGRFMYGGNGNGDNSSYGYYEPDYREGKSHIMRRSYMESKEMNKDKTVQMQELEKYMQELANDLTDMIKDSTPEEKTMLQQKLTLLANKLK